MNFQLTPGATSQLSLIPVPPGLTAKQVDDYLSVVCGRRILWTSEGLVVYKSQEEKAIVDLMRAVAFYNEVARATQP